MKILLLDGATETLELADDVSLRAANPVAAGRVRPDGHELLDVLVGAGAVESTRRFSRRRANNAGQRRRCGLWVFNRTRSLVATSRHEENSDNHRAETHSPESRSHLTRSLTGYRSRFRLSP